MLIGGQTEARFNFHRLPWAVWPRLKVKSASGQWPIAGLPPAFNSPVTIYTPGLKEVLWGQIVLPWKTMRACAPECNTPTIRQLCLTKWERGCKGRKELIKAKLVWRVEVPRLTNFPPSHLFFFFCPRLNQKSKHYYLVRHLHVLLQLLI